MVLILVDEIFISYIKSFSWLMAAAAAAQIFFFITLDNKHF